MTKPFTGTQAELADELDQLAEVIDLREITSDQSAGDAYGRIAAFTQAATLVRSAIITPNPLHDAAPDMLAALEEAVVWFDGFPAGHMDNKWPDDLYDTVLTAVARAKGTPDA